VEAGDVAAGDVAAGDVAASEVRARLAGTTARLLLRLAGRRWPLSIRDERWREWSAELHVLARARRWGRMVRFAFSLAVTRPAREPRRALWLDGRFWLTAAALIVAPGAALVLGFAGMLLGGLGVVGLVMLAGLLWWCGLLAAFAGLAGGLVRRRYAVPAVLLPGLAVVLYLPALGVGEYGTLTGPSLVWVALVAAVLIVVGAVPRPVSWWIGYAGVVAATWIAVTWAVWRYVTPGIAGPEGMFSLDSSYAWLWFPASLTQVDVGPGPGGSMGTDLGGWWVVADFTEVYPFVLLALGVFAVGYVLGVCEHRDFPEPAVVPAR
jgi:hypothetical protein